MISTLIGRNSVVSLGSFADGTENTAVEYNKDQDGDKSQSHRIGDQNVIPGILQIFAEFRGCHDGNLDFFRYVFILQFIKNGRVFVVDLGAKFKESWDVENDAVR